MVRDTEVTTVTHTHTTTDLLEVVFPVRSAETAASLRNVAVARNVILV